MSYFYYDSYINFENENENEIEILNEIMAYALCWDSNNNDILNFTVKFYNYLKLFKIIIYLLLYLP